MYLTEALRRGQNFEAELHPLETVLVSVSHSLDRVVGVFSLDLLPFLEHRADNQNAVHRHCLEGQTQVSLSFYGQLGKCYG